jgi:CDP-diacylglycerol--serine O-phosphatidyltransferase
MNDSSEVAVENRGRGIYLLPNLFTLTALFAGFYSIVAAMIGRFELAAIAIFIAMILDALDGRVARLTNTQTNFGAELDSLSDMVSFGVAPALLSYSWSLHALGKIGWLAAFIFTATVALRLARFNTRKSTDKRYFQGLACPAGAGIVASIIWLAEQQGFVGISFSIPMAIVTVGIGLLMVSNFPYRSFKDLDLKDRIPFFAMLLVALVLVLIAMDPPKVLFITLIGYGLSGPLVRLWVMLKKRRGLKQGNPH